MKTLFLFAASLLLSSLSFSQRADLESAEGYPFEVSITGSGSHSILFIPGFACSSDVWNETLPLFESEWQCHALTMAGFAGAAPQDSISFTLWRDEIARYIQQNELDKPIVIGHSMGGGLALAIASEYPDLLQSIVVVDALPCLAATSNPEFESDPTPDCQSSIDQMVAMPDEDFLAMQQNTMRYMMSKHERLEETVQWSIDSDRTTFAAMFCDFFNTDQRESIAKITCPTLVLLESYFIHQKEAIAQQYAACQTAELRYANQGLHFIMYDDPEWYKAQLTQFISLP